MSSSSCSSSSACSTSSPSPSSTAAVDKNPWKNRNVSDKAPTAAVMGGIAYWPPLSHQIHNTTTQPSLPETDQISVYPPRPPSSANVAKPISGIRGPVPNRRRRGGGGAHHQSNGYLAQGYSPGPQWQPVFFPHPPPSPPPGVWAAPLPPPPPFRPPKFNYYYNNFYHEEPWIESNVLFYPPPPPPPPPYPMAVRRSPNFAPQKNWNWKKGNGNHNRKILKVKLRNQIEFYFSIDNLVTDIYLRCHMDHEGWVDLSLIAEFNKVKDLTSDIKIIREALLSSTSVELKENKVRRRHEWNKYLMPCEVSVRSSMQMMQLGEEQTPSSETTTSG